VTICHREDVNFRDRKDQLAIGKEGLPGDFSTDRMGGWDWGRDSPKTEREEYFGGKGKTRRRSGRGAVKDCAGVREESKRDGAIQEGRLN